jgi:hypothetical protein
MRPTTVLVAVALAGTLALACRGGTGAQPGPAAPAAPPEAAAPPAPAPAAAPAAPPVSPVEPGFTYCCGDDQMRMEILCGDMLKRCYQKVGGRWKQTYGRHCRERLGDSCFLEDCDAKCQ